MKMYMIKSFQAVNFSPGKRRRHQDNTVRVKFLSLLIMSYGNDIFIIFCCFLYKNHTLHINTQTYTLLTVH